MWYCHKKETLILFYVRRTHGFPVLWSQTLECKWTSLCIHIIDIFTQMATNNGYMYRLVTKLNNLPSRVTVDPTIHIYRRCTCKNLSRVQIHWISQVHLDKFQFDSRLPNRWNEKWTNAMAMVFRFRISENNDCLIQSFSIFCRNHSIVSFWMFSRFSVFHSTKIP